jgi:hypothetical protein
VNTAMVLLIVGGFALVGLIAFLQYKAHKKKVAAFAAFAAQRGWQYTERDRSLRDRFLGSPFGKGHGREARHVLHGAHRGRQILAFEYIYKETQNDSNGQSSTRTYYHTVVSASLPSHKPTLEIGREGFGRKLLGLVGVRDLQLESEQFNETYRIKTENERFAYDILHPRMMEWMLTDQRALQYGFRFERGDLVVWERQKVDLGNVVRMLDYVCDILDQVPGFVWKS